MRRSKQMQIMVDDANLYFKHNAITETSDAVFIIITAGLIHAGCYHGYNWHDERGCLNPKNKHHLYIY